MIKLIDHVTGRLLDPDDREAARCIGENTMDLVMATDDGLTDNPEHVRGAVAFGVFVAVVRHLTEAGWDADELVNIIRHEAAVAAVGLADEPG